MSEDWSEHFVDVLKHLEVESNGKQIHQFRRSFQGGNKKDRLLPQLETIYQKCKEHFEEESFQAWFNSQKFKLTLGRKNILLHTTYTSLLFKEKLMRLFTKWDPALFELLPPPTTGPTNNNMGFSRKQMRMAMRKIQSMGDSQLSSVLQNVPQGHDINEEELNTVFDTKSADRIKSAMHK